MKYLLCFLSVFSIYAYAIPEENYSLNLEQKVLPYFNSFQKAELEVSPGLIIRYRFKYSPQATKTLVVLPGRGEPAQKYAEVLYDLKSSKLNFFVIDHRGQGESSRMLSDPQKGYVQNFQNYVSDLHLFMERVVLPHTQGTEHLLLAHSMGGAIGVHYLAQNPGIFSKAFLNAPMLKLNTKPYAEIVAKIYSLFLMKTGKSSQYAPGKGPYIASEDTFEKNLTTHSEVRFQMNKYLLTKNPQLVVGGPTVQWVHSALKATGRIQHLGPRIQVPIFILQSGHDEYVKNERQDSFCQKTLDCQSVLYPQAYHEILMEKDDVRNDALKKIRSFFKL